MRQLVENNRCQLDIVPTDHRAQNGIVKMSERGIGGDAADHDVEALSVQPGGEFARFGFDEIAPVADASDDGKTPFFRLDGKMVFSHLRMRRLPGPFPPDRTSTHLNSS